MTSAEQTSGGDKRRHFLVPQFIFTQMTLYRELGFRQYIRGSGKWIFILVVVYYLVRDVTLYIIIPYLVISGVISCPGSGISG